MPVGELPVGYFASGEPVRRRNMWTTLVAWLVTYATGMVCAAASAGRSMAAMAATQGARQAKLFLGFKAEHSCDSRHALGPQRVGEWGASGEGAQMGSSPVRACRLFSAPAGCKAYATRRRDENRVNPLPCDGVRTANRTMMRPRMVLHAQCVKDQARDSNVGRERINGWSNRRGGSSGWPGKPEPVVEGLSSAGRFAQLRPPLLPGRSPSCGDSLRATRKVHAHLGGRRVHPATARATPEFFPGCPA